MKKTTGLVAGIIAAGIAPAHAQQGSSAGASFALEEITVTAQRRQESLQDVPLAVSAFSAADIETYSIEETEDIIRFVPNVYSATSTGLGSANSYYLRGLGSSESLATFDQPIGTYVNDVYLSRYGANNFSLFDVERIEVLRGPQGTLFGRNTTGGAINVVLKDPADEIGGFAGAEYGRYNHVLLRGSVDMPLSDTVRTKLSGYWTDDEGYVKNLTTGERLNSSDGFGVRGAVQADISEAVLWDLSIDYSKKKEPFILNTKTDDGRVSNSGLMAMGSVVAGQKGQIGGNENNVDLFRVASNIQVATDLGEVEFITGYVDLTQKFNLDFFDGTFPTGGFVFNQLSTHEQISQEIKLTGDTDEGRLNYTVGAFYLEEENNIDFADIFTLPIGPNGFPFVLADRTIDADILTYAFYGQFDYEVIPRLTLTAGARWTYENKDLAFIPNPGSNWGTPFTQDDLVAAGVPLELTEKVLTPRFAISYQAMDDVMFFASATRGFKSGGWNGRATTADTLQPFGPETIWSYEAGMRSEFFDNRLRFNATAFLGDTSDLQIPTAFNNQAGGITFLTQNFADFEVTGLEVEAVASVAEGFNLRGALGLMDAKYKNPEPGLVTQLEQCQDQIAAGGATPSCGNGVVTLNGELAEPNRTPDVTFSIGFDYTVGVTNDIDLVAVGNLHHMGARSVESAQLPISEVESTQEVQASMSAVSRDGNWQVGVECENCLGETYLVSVIGGRPYINDPSTWKISTRINF